MKPLLQKRPKADENYYLSRMGGSICDDFDCIIECCGLPKIAVGDWVLLEIMNVYTVTAASSFSGFQRSTIYYVMSRPTWQLMQQFQDHNIPPKVEEQDISTLPVSCALESEMKCHSAACASAYINV
ncbi:hypothetical protein HJG60_012201 [Phyllostomus discolor]|uniref:ornithine decarboxylase n=1 Tax=Phyllostomus discolor TaxID=89673 RepID=A0A833ZBA0_9CHIR|nr:hypothetical protein HJG60_012201 [Phyllostomus discolor]